MFNKNKNFYLIKIKLKIQPKRSFITLYRILQAYSDKTFLLVLLKIL